MFISFFTFSKSPINCTSDNFIHIIGYLKYTYDNILSYLTFGKISLYLHIKWVKHCLDNEKFKEQEKH